MKNCYSCKLDLPVESFSPKHRGLQYKCKDCRAFDERQRNRQAKSEVFNAYGGRCNCCGEIETIFLTIDHILPCKGGRNRSHLDLGAGLYKRLRREKYPEGYQLLCFNCNFAKSRLGKCPHQLCIK